VEHVASGHAVAAPEGVPRPVRRGWLGRWRSLLPSIGVSPTFRVYLFAGGIVAILVFFLYNEAVIHQVRDQEKRNLDLYGKLISLVPLAEEEQEIAIFQIVSLNPSISFPVIVTDHTGRVTQFKNIDGNADGLGTDVARRWRRLAFWHRADRAVAGDSVAALQARLVRLAARMDATNEPIAFYPVPSVTGRAYAAAGNVVVTDGQDRPVRWQGADLPDPADTTTAARTQVSLFVAGAGARAEPLAFELRAGSPGYLYFDGTDLVVADRTRRAVAWRGEGLPAPRDTTQAARASVVQRLGQMEAASRRLAFEIPAYSFIHYGDSSLVRRMSQATYAQIVALLLFLLVAYAGFRNIQRSEQRSIWIGMARETAHQLGTPLSSLSGWLELLQARLHDPPEAEASAHDASQLEPMLREMSRDMQRLTQIASRFSQIGSVPELQTGDVVAILSETASYFRARAPHFGQCEILLSIHGPIPPVPLNPDLMRWVFENLFKNAIDALEGASGSITIDVRVGGEPRMVRVTFADTGRGIAPEHLRRVFDPGFSTKKRGWGLGLAFARRIVEEYHGGRIGVVRTVVGQGTVFELSLPVAARR
jgi:two-component system, NtrC family, sensor histidine kinase KinB